MFEALIYVCRGGEAINLHDSNSKNYNVFFPCLVFLNLGMYRFSRLEIFFFLFFGSGSDWSQYILFKADVCMETMRWKHSRFGSSSSQLPVSLANYKKYNTFKNRPWFERFFLVFFFCINSQIYDPRTGELLSYSITSESILLFLHSLYISLDKNGVSLP